MKTLQILRSAWLGIFYMCIPTGVALGYVYGGIPQQILDLIQEADGERFEDAVARVCRCVGGGAATENVDSDSDLEICAMSLWNYGPDVMDALVELVVALASSSGKYVDLCLDMLVSNFIPHYNSLEILKQPCGLTKKDQVISRVHFALKEIADLVPLAP